jgi:hypothetical protein
MDALTYFYVTREPGEGFICLLTLGEVHARLAAGELKEDYYATESDGRSFAQFKRSGAGHWRTLAALFREQSVHGALAHRGSASGAPHAHTPSQQPQGSLWRDLRGLAVVLIPVVVVLGSQLPRLGKGMKKKPDDQRQWLRESINLGDLNDPPNGVRTCTAREFLRTVYGEAPKGSTEQVEVERSVFLSKVGKPHRLVWWAGKDEEWYYACKDTQVLLYVRAYRENSKEYFQVRGWWEYFQNPR